MKRRRSRPVAKPLSGVSHPPLVLGAAAVFVVAFAVRLIHIWQIRRAPFFSVLMGDAQGYDAWAQRIASGDWLGREVFYQAPLYPYFLGCIYGLFGRDLLIVRVCQAIVGSAACVFLALTARRLFSPQTGLIAGLMLALYAPAVFFDGLLQKTVLDVFFTCLALWILSGLVNKSSNRAWIALGVTMGALALTRENALVLVGVVFLWAVLRRRSSLNERAAAGLSLVLGLSLLLVPVALRNHAVGGGFYLTTSQFGPNFYIGNNPRADGTYMSLRFGRGAPEFERQDATELAQRAMGRTLTPGEVSTYWTDRALDFITSQPVKWLTLLGRKFVLLWNRTEMLDTESQETYAEWSDPIRLGSWIGHFGILVPLAVFGLWTSWPQRRQLLVFYVIAAAYAASVLMFYVFARYRFPLVPGLILFAAAGLDAGRGFISTSAAAAKYRMAVAVGAVALLTNWPTLSATTMQAVTETNLAAALHEQGRLDEAIDHYRRAIALQSDYSPAFTNLGVTLVAKGRVDEGVAAYQQALALRPDYPEAHYNLADALLKQHRPAEATNHLRVAVQSMPESVEVRNNLGIALATEGRLDEAVAEFRRSVQIDPGSAKARRNLADVLTSLGRHDEAIAQFREAIAIEPGNGSLHYDLGSTLLEANRLPEAIDEFRIALQLEPNSVEAHNNLGIALGTQGHLDEAIVQFQLALKLEPQSVDAQRNLAAALQARRR